MDSKTVVHKVRFVVPAGQASANQTLSQLFAKLAINLANFCEEFNDKTSGLELEEDETLLLTVSLTSFNDKSFAYTIEKPTTSMLILLAAEFIQGKKEKLGVLSLEDLLVIAKFKFEGSNIQSACSSILGTARGVGVKLR